MGMLDRFKKKPEDLEERASISHSSYGSFSITSFFGDGALVTEEEAMKVPTVASSVELISSAIAQLPIYLYKENEKGEIERIRDDKREFLLNNEPNELINGYNFKKQIVKDYLFHGASYTKVDRIKNNVLAMYNLPIKEISITKYLKDGYKYSAIIDLLYQQTGVRKKVGFSPEELVIVLRDSEDGVTSTGILKNNSDTIKLALDEQDYTTNILKNGALPIGVLKSATRLTQGAIDRLRTSWESLYGGAKRSGKTIILEEGLDYHPISMKPNEMDLTNSKKSTIAEIARIFQVPLSMIDSSANKYASNEQNNIHFLQFCLSPIIISIESSLNKSLLLESEKRKGYYFRFDTSEIVRTTEADKIKTIVLEMQSGLLSINEARSKIDEKALNVDYFTWNLGSVFFDSNTKQMIIPNLGQILDPSKPQSMNQNIVSVDSQEVEIEEMNK